MKGDLSVDPSGLIREAYRMDGITGPDCRSIFFDWALGLDPSVSPKAAIEELIDFYAPANPAHPMTVVLREVDRDGFGSGGRRGGRRARIKDDQE